MTLDLIRKGNKAVVTKVCGCGYLRSRILDMGFVPGTVISIGKAAPFGDPVVVSLRGYTLTLRREDMRNILVEEVWEWL